MKELRKYMQENKNRMCLRNSSHTCDFYEYIKFAESTSIYRLIPRTFLTRRPTVNEIAATLRLIPAITRKLRRNDLPFTTEV